ncbi:hypothetical protein BHM03_00014029 [Ensete ventricosum]|nr:hypothetical protein BHM03_00014029 [Ensete ventricosum]
MPRPLSDLGPRISFSGRGAITTRGWPTEDDVDLLLDRTFGSQERLCDRAGVGAREATRVSVTWRYGGPASGGAPRFGAIGDSVCGGAVMGVDCLPSRCVPPPCLLSKHCWFTPVCASSPAVVSVRSWSSVGWVEPRGVSTLPVLGRSYDHRRPHTCVRPASPYRVGHVDGPIVRGRDDVTARSTSVISLVKEELWSLNLFGCNV